MSSLRVFAIAILTLATGILCRTHAVEPSGTLPVLHITTADNTPITSKINYVSATCHIDPMDLPGADSLGSEQAPIKLLIRGRGHSSWKSAKKPYKIKLANRVPLLGMPDHKHWALIKPTESTVAGFHLAEMAGMEWTPSFRPVEVVLNGDYIGLYFLTETPRISQNRVDIFQQQDLETDPSVIPGGWLVEIDNYYESSQIRIRENDDWNLALTYHSPSELSDAQSKWLSKEFRTINAAIYAADKSSTDWEKHIDIDAMARFFIIQEVMDNPDGFHGSFYLHKDAGADALWTAGPVWDLTCYNREKTDYTFRMKVHYGFTPHWIGELLRYDRFCQAVADAWSELYPSLAAELKDHIYSTVVPLGPAWQRDALRWNEDPTQTALFRADRLSAALERNIEWFDAHLPAARSGIHEIAPDSANAAVRVYNIQGAQVATFPDERTARASLPAGLYIINGTKLLIR